MNLKTLVSMVNRELINTKDSEFELRRAFILLVEESLFKEGQYKGFRYLTIGEFNGSVPGIQLDGSFENADSTRINYYLNENEVKDE